MELWEPRSYAEVVAGQLQRRTLHSEAQNTLHDPFLPRSLHPVPKGAGGGTKGEGRVGQTSWLGGTPARADASEEGGKDTSHLYIPRAASSICPPF